MKILHRFIELVVVLVIFGAQITLAQMSLPGGWSLCPSSTGTTTKGPAGCGAPFLTGIVAWWTLDDLTGNDASGDGYTLTLLNSPTSVTGQITNAVSFVSASSQNASQSSVSTPMGSLGTASLTTWCKSSSQFVVGFNNGNARFSILATSGSIFFIVENGGVSYLDETYALDGNMHQYALVFNGSLVGAARVAAYIDGVVQNSMSLVGSLPSTLNTSGNLSTFNVANYQGTDYTQTTDDTRLYSIALTSGQISTTYAANILGCP